ncbi:MAG: DUF1343 domain-containing protein [Candidatus Marinimicrobia bacterium]|nr:DUF1343 domain-containing protein [Candidatus Neomarinimicrobiota bacterium]
MRHKILLPLLAFALFLTGCSVRTGLDNAAKADFSMFRGKNVGVVANHTSLDRHGNHVADLLHQSEGLTLKAILAPEHGFRGTTERGVHIERETDEKTGVPVLSIYGSTRKPTPEMLAGLDVLVFDIQDVGARFYTYISTMFNILEAAAENNIPVYILDRPNPIGRLAEGPVMQPGYTSFVGMFAIPLRHGMTVGELALMIRDKGWINAADKLDLQIVRMSNWNPEKSYETTKLPWVAPSPNIRNLNEALVYPGTCLFEGTNFSEGRGTLYPFEWVGASYMKSDEVIRALEARNIPGIDIRPVGFTPQDIPGTAMDPKFEGVPCEGIALTVTDPVHFRSLEFGIHLIDVLNTLYPEDFSISRPDFLGQLWGNGRAVDMFNAKRPVAEIIGSYREELDAFLAEREKYLLY